MTNEPLTFPGQTKIWSEDGRMQIALSGGGLDKPYRTSVKAEGPMGKALALSIINNQLRQIQVSLRYDGQTMTLDTHHGTYRVFASDAEVFVVAPYEAGPHQHPYSAPFLAEGIKAMGWGKLELASDDPTLAKCVAAWAKLGTDDDFSLLTYSGGSAVLYSDGVFTGFPVTFSQAAEMVADLSMPGLELVLDITSMHRLLTFESELLGFLDKFDALAKVVQFDGASIKYSDANVDIIATFRNDGVDEGDETGITLTDIKVADRQGATESTAAHITTLTRALYRVFNARRTPVTISVDIAPAVAEDSVEDKMRQLLDSVREQAKEFLGADDVRTLIDAMEKTLAEQD